MTKKNEKADEFHHHEMIDRLHVIMCTLEEHLINNLVADENEKIKDLIIKAQDNLMEAYQKTSRISFDKFGDGEGK